MNTYVITCRGAHAGRSTIQATNIHTAIKKVFYPMRPWLGRNIAETIKKGEKVTIEVERIA